jgi:hypothetical protein
MIYIADRWIMDFGDSKAPTGTIREVHLIHLGGYFHMDYGTMLSIHEDHRLVWRNQRGKGAIEEKLLGVLTSNEYQNAMSSLQTSSVMSVSSWIVPPLDAGRIVLLLVTDDGCKVIDADEPESLPFDVALALWSIRGLPGRVQRAGSPPR